MYLRRGQIVVANLGRDARGWEIGNKKEDGGPIRPVVVVSSYFSNQKRLRVTVVPVTNYKTEGKELKINWGFWISKGSVQDCSLTSDESLVDCGQLMTIFAVPANHSLSRQFPNDINYEKFCGKLRDRLRLDLSLQIICNQELIIPPEIWKKRFGATPILGDIVRTELPISAPNASPRERRALVVSASAIDGIRNTIPLGHITVVPLRKIPHRDFDETSGFARIAVTGIESNEWLVNCQEPCTIDWKKRNTEVIGRIKDSDSMARVMHGLRQYLDLPAQGVPYGVTA